MSDFVSLDKTCSYSIWAPIYSAHPLTRFGIQLFIAFAGFAWLFMWIFFFRHDTTSSHAGTWLLNIPLAVFGTYQLAGIGRRLYLQWKLDRNGQPDTAAVAKVECKKKETEWAYWRITATTSRSGMTVTLDLTSRVEQEPVKEGSELRLLYWNEATWMIK